jgi:leucyl aminopeptidase
LLNVRMTAAAAGGPLAIPVREGVMPEAYAPAAEAAGFTGATGTACEIFGGTPSSHIILAGLGTAPDRLAAEQAGAVAAARALRSVRLTIDAATLSAELAAACAAGACLRAWRYDRLWTQERDDAPLLAHLDILTHDAAVAAAWAREAPAVEGTLFARELVTEPSDTLTPAGFLARLAKLTEAGVTLQVLDRDALRAGAFGGMLAVSQGSVHAPFLAVLRWAGTEEGAPIAFVGKGITFDTGGICIKPADKMWEMRADMAGAAACAGAMLAIALRRSPRPAMAVLALAENAISGSSYRPGDVITSLSGTTVEVVDTDAEGRLVLMDALTYAARAQPAAMVDLATLTGSVVVALGHEMAGCFDNHAALAGAVVAAGAAVGEKVWRMPIDGSHSKTLESDIADLRHCTPETMQPDACIGAAFLREFAGNTPWVHIDIGGVDLAQDSSDARGAGASGFGVRLLNRLHDTWPT